MQRDSNARTFAEAAERERLLTEEASRNRSLFCRIPGGDEEHMHGKPSPEMHANRSDHAPQSGESRSQSYKLLS
jgi:hypothetical protein